MSSALRFDEAPRDHFGIWRALLTERSGGLSPPPYATLNLGRSTRDRPENVHGNERLVEEALRLRWGVARLRLEHGSRVLRTAEEGLQGPADALLTEDPDLALWLTVADCYPVFLVCGQVRALGHCGWRGVAAGLVEAMVKAVEETAARREAGAAKPPQSHGALRRAMRAWIAPGIGPCCYPVGPEVAARFPGCVSPDPALGSGAGGPLRLDLRRAIELRLAACGLPPTSIAGSRACTSCRADRFFSHRRDGPLSGRMAAVFFRRSR